VADAALDLLRVLAVIGAAAGAWRSYRALGTPLVRGGKRWYRQPDGRYRRWWGGPARSEEDLPE
jgi:hypothetical protein